MIHAIQQRHRETAVPAKPVPPPKPRRSPGKRQGRGLASCRRASVALEFALASVPLLMLVFGFIASSAVFNTLGSMQSTSQYAARLMATGTITRNNSGALSSSNTTATVTCSSSLTTSQIEYYACQSLPSWATFSVTTTENCATPSVTVSLSVDASSAALADIESFFSGKTLTAQTVMMKEGSCP